jgi:hypothetical protein
VIRSSSGKGGKGGEVVHLLFECMTGMTDQVHGEFGDWQLMGSECAST